MRVGRTRFRRTAEGQALGLVVGVDGGAERSAGLFDRIEDAAIERECRVAHRKEAVAFVRGDDDAERFAIDLDGYWPRCGWPCDDFVLDGTSLRWRRSTAAGC